MIVFLIVILCPIGQQATALKQLSGALINLYENTTQRVDEVERSYNRMKSNPTFNDYYMTWMERQPAERYDDSVTEVLPSCEGYCMKGIYYLKTGKPEQAEQAFHTASNMVPTRIRPKYLLWQCYIEKGDTVAAKEIAQKILNCPLKTESIYTLKVKKEVKNSDLTPSPSPTSPVLRTPSPQREGKRNKEFERGD
jgi:tetratricopeptide (TPR) repeat protein